jgi:AraC-like DNA-binding protein
MTEVHPPNWYISLTSRPVTMRAGRGVFVPGVSKQYLVGRSSLTERHYSIYWVLLVPEFRGEITIDEFAFSVRPGVMVIAPPHSTITLRFERKSVQYYAHISLPCGREPGILIPCVTQLRRKRALIEELFRQGVAAFQRNDLGRANETFGQILEIVANLPPEQNITRRGLPHIARDALRLIEDRLHRPIYVDELAVAVGLSHRQLLNLFQRHLHTTITGYVRGRRVERALVLLRTTNVAVKAIAPEVGIDDLQVFNKLIRRAVGVGPRAYRAQSKEHAPVEAA